MLGFKNTSYSPGDEGDEQGLLPKELLNCECVCFVLSFVTHPSSQGILQLHAVPVQGYLGCHLSREQTLSCELAKDREGEYHGKKEGKWFE